LRRRPVGAAVGVQCRRRLGTAVSLSQRGRAGGAVPADQLDGRVLEIGTGRTSLSRLSYSTGSIRADIHWAQPRSNRWTQSLSTEDFLHVITADHRHRLWSILPNGSIG
jgi:hypothetical protein